MNGTPQTIKPVPMALTLILINNFMISTTNFVNSFSETVEKKISNISSKVTELEILLAVLEAKLNSIPGLEFSSGDLPPTAPPSSSAPATSVPAGALPSSSTAPAQAAPAAAAAPPPPPQQAGIAAKDHPSYAPFFKMLRVGVPQPVVTGKVTAAGLNPDILADPEAIIPEDGASTAVVSVTSTPVPVPVPVPAPPAVTETALVPVPPPAETAPTATATAAVAAAEPENPQYEVYKRMRRMLPEGPVRQKMQNDGCTDEEIDRFFAS